MTKPSDPTLPKYRDSPLIRLVTWLSTEHHLLLEWKMGSPERCDRAISHLGLDAVGESMARLAKAIPTTDAAVILAQLAKETKR